MSTFLKTFSTILLCVSVSFGTDSKAQSIHQSPAIQFLFHLFQKVQEASPKQNKAFKQYEKDLNQLLMQARKLDLQYHKLSQQGLKSKNERKAIKAKGRALLTQALEKTELYLKQLADSLHHNRDSILKHLYPEGKE